MKMRHYTMAELAVMPDRTLLLGKDGSLYLRNSEYGPWRREAVLLKSICYGHYSDTELSCKRKLEQVRIVSKETGEVLYG